MHGSLFAGLLALGACRDPKVTTYRVPKEPVAELPASKPTDAATSDAAAKATLAASDDRGPINAAMAASPAGLGDTPALPSGHPATPGATAGADPHAQLQTAADEALTWTAPSGWQAKPPSMMRKATYVISGDNGASAELAISAFPGDVGGEVANVNRWRGQVGLAEVGATEAAAAIERLDVNGLKVGIVDVVDHAAASPTHLIGAMVPVQGATWFFKLTGPDAVVAPQKTAFVAFIKTLQPAAPHTP